jgi:lysophospholipase L1-like esterase
MRILGGLLVAVTFMIGCSSDEDSAGAGGIGGTSTGGSSGTGGIGGAGGSAGVSGAGGSAGVPATPEVRFVGRVDRSSAETVSFEWSGSAIGFRFDGTEASVRMDDAAGFFSVVIDGQEQPRLETSPGEQSYSVASGLAAGQHEVWLYRRTEAFFGLTRFTNVELGSGTLLAPPPPAGRRIEIIGDSITCGYGNEGADQYCNFSADTENHDLTYGAIAARNLDAELVTVAWSGKGIVYNYGDDKNEPLPALYDRAIPTDASSSWDFTSYQPDVVVINLGTNDFSTDGDPSETEFVAAYTDFLAHIRSKYPKAHVLCLIPTLLGGADLTTAQSHIEKAVSERNAAGDAKVTSHSLSFEQSGWGCDWHPSASTHASMGAALTSELELLLGW